jgi:hypothetical protein
MLTKDFYVRGEFLKKRDPHSFTPPLSVVGVSNKQYFNNLIMNEISDEIHV